MKSYKAFTSYCQGRASVLISEVRVHPSFDPKTDNAPPRPGETFQAIWDTGATSTVITSNIVKKCGLIQKGIINLGVVGGEVKTVSTYLIAIMLPNGVGIPKISVAESDIIGDSEMLIGMDIIGLGDFAVSSFNGKTAFSFRMPSVGTVDFVKDIEKLNRVNQPYIASRKVGRNDLCTCGSGKKYKKCHGY